MAQVIYSVMQMRRDVVMQSPTEVSNVTMAPMVYQTTAAVTSVKIVAPEVEAVEAVSPIAIVMMDSTVMVLKFVRLVVVRHEHLWCVMMAWSVLRTAVTR